MIEEIFEWFNVKQSNQENQALFWIFLTEHTFSYIVSLYRKYEIKKFGVPDVNGILRAKNEYVLRNIQVFIECMIIGYVIKYLIETDEKLHGNPFFYYWIILDSIVMIFGLLFNYLNQLMRTEGEVVKNIFTLHYVQNNKLNDNKRVKAMSEQLWRRIPDILSNLKGALFNIKVQPFLLSNESTPTSSELE